MSSAGQLREEIGIWRLVWQQVETFLDRIDGARGSDAGHGDKIRALLTLLAASEEEKKWRTGRGCEPPLEIALARGSLSMSGIAKELTIKGPNNDVDLTTPTFDPEMRKRLPGTFDLEIAVAGMRVQRVPEPDPEEPDPDQDVKIIVNDLELVASQRLFERFDDKEKRWEELVAPLYDFGKWPGGAVYPSPKGGHFPRGLRLQAITDGKADMRKWSVLFTERTTGILVEKEHPQQINDLALVDPAKRNDARAAAQAAIAVCDRGAGELGALTSTFNELGFDSDAAQAKAELEKRAKDYREANQLLSGAADPGKLATLAAKLRGRGDVLPPAVVPKLLTALDEQVNRRIVYPDGSLRILRALEWGLRVHWRFREAWFADRYASVLNPLLRRFLSPFFQSLRDLLRHHHTAVPFTARLAQPAAANAVALSISPRADGSPHDLSSLEPGQVAVIEGNRRALAVLVAPDSSEAGKPQRLRITPLRVSLGGGVDAPGIAGMVEGGSLVDSGPVAGVSEAALQAGSDPAQAHHDGVLQEVIALWSRLALVAGTNEVGAQLSANGVTPPALSALPRTVKLPVLAPVAPKANQLVMDVAAVVPLYNIDGPNKPPFGRQGELFLLRGKDAGGLWHQTVVEILEIKRTTAEALAEGTDGPAPLGKPICCTGPGNRLLVTVKDTPLPKPLVEEVTLHRDFRGFGAPSLACRKLLPTVVDTTAETAGEGRDIDRSFELEAASKILDTWLPS